MRRCTNRYLEEEYRLTDESGQTIAVMIDGEFKRWEAGSWRSKFDVVGRTLKRRGLRTFEAARKAARVSMLKRTL